MEQKSAQAGWAWLVLAVSTGSLVCSPVWAHTGTGLPGGFLSGFRHPLSGMDHLLAMISVGLWGAFLGRPLIYVLPVIFPMMMVIGAIMGMFALPLPPTEIGIAMSVLVLGGCIALCTETDSPHVQKSMWGRDLRSCQSACCTKIGRLLARW